MPPNLLCCSFIMVFLLYSRWKCLVVKVPHLTAWIPTWPRCVFDLSIWVNKQDDLESLQDLNFRQGILTEVFTYKFHHWFKKVLNTSYLTDAYIGFTLKMESVSKNTIFGLKMMVKSGLEKNLFEIPPCGRLLSLTS